MITTNRIEFTDSKISMLSNARKLYTNKEPFRVNGKSYRLKLRVSPRTKTFCILKDGKRLSIGEFSKEFGVANATMEAIKVVSEEATVHVKKPKLLFKDLAEWVFSEKERKGRKSVEEERYIFSRLPKHLLNMPIEKITREMALEWKESFLSPTRSARYWNNVVSVPTNIWNECAKGKAFTLLENRRNPFSELKEESVRTLYPVPKLSDLVELWKASNSLNHPFLPLICKLKILTGMHLTEIVNIREQDIQDGWLTINHKIDRHIPFKHKIYLHPVTRKLFTQLIKLSNMSVPERLLFSADGFNPYNRKSFAKHWNTVLKKANMQFRFDRLRDSLITEMRDSGFNSSYITGHCYKENIQAKFYTDWESEKIRESFKEANTYWQTKVYEAVKSDWF